MMDGDVISPFTFNRHDIMPHITRILRLLVILAALIPPVRVSAQRDDAEWLAQCQRGGWDRREKFCEVRQVRMAAPGGTITVDGLRNGGVSVIGADRDSLIVKTRVEAQARTQAEAREIVRQVRTVIRGATISAEGPRGGDDSWWTASLVIWAPRRSDLRLSSHNGPVSVEDVSGDMELETHNGPLALRGLSGSVRARTSNGPLSVMLTGNKWVGAGLDAETNNGPLSLRVPEGYSAHLEAATNNGPMSLGFPVTVVGRIGKNISTDLGSGGTTIRAVTHNGPLSIEHR
jgi:hypothetical protein